MPETPTGATITYDRNELVVAPPCDDDDGKWYCLTCSEHLTRAASNRHDRQGHRLVWFCYDHGPEGRITCGECAGKGGQEAPSTHDPDRWAECPYCGGTGFEQPPEGARP